MTSEPRSGSGESARPQAVRELARPDSADRMPRLLQALKDDSWRVRREAVDALLAQTGCESTGAMLRVMRNHVTDLGLFNSAIQVVSRSGVDTFEPLVELLDDNDPELRICAALTLGNQNDRRAVPALLRTLGDPDANVCYHAIEALGKLKSCEAVDSLMKLVESRDFALAFPALDALSSIGDARAAGPLTALLDDPTLRQPAIEAIGWLGGRAAVGPLIDVLHGHRALATAVAMALNRMRERYETRYGRGDLIESAIRLTITEEDAKILVDAAAGVDGPELEAIAHVLGGLEGVAVDQTLAQLLLRLASRSAAAEAMVRRGARVVDLLVERSSDDDAEVRKMAIAALGRIGDAKAVPALLNALRSDPDSIGAAAGALAMIGALESYPTLLGMLGDENATVRRAVVSALNSLGHPQMAVDMERCFSAIPIRMFANPQSASSATQGFRHASQAMLGCCPRRERAGPQDCARSIAGPRRRPRPAGARGGSCGSGSRRTRSRGAGPRADRPRRGMAAARDGAWRQERMGSVLCRAARLRARTIAASRETLNRLAELDPAMQVRIAAVEALGQLGDASSIPLLATLAQSPDTDLVRTAIAALGATRQVDAMPPLTIALESPDAARRIDALRALGSTGPCRRLRPSLHRAAQSALDAGSAKTAIEALGQIPCPEAIAALISLSAHPLRQGRLRDRLLSPRTRRCRVSSAGD